MIKKSLLKKFGRRLRVGFVGGGIDSVVGDTHLAAMRMDGKYDLVAGVMSINIDISKLSGLRQLIDKNRIYENYREMAHKEFLHKDKIDVVVNRASENAFCFSAVFSDFENVSAFSAAGFLVSKS